jgi:hypothetical protein
MPPYNPNNNQNNLPNNPVSPYGPPGPPNPYPSSPYSQQPQVGGSYPQPAQQLPQQAQQPMFNQPFQSPYAQPQAPQQAAFTPPPVQQQYQQPAPQPNVPFFLDPNGPYAHIGAAPRRKRKRKGPVLAVFGLLALIVIAIPIVMSKAGNNGADELFQSAVANSLTTHSYSQKEVVGQDNIQIRQDVTDITKPRQSGTVDLISVGAKLEGYSSVANSYIRYTKFPDTAGPSTATILNKWEQIRKNGVMPAAYKQSFGFEELFDARTSILGNFIIGSFAAPDQQALISLIQTKGVYSYDSNSVSTETVDGEPVMRFDVTINANALTELNQKAGAMMHLPQADVDAVIKRIDPATVAKDTIKMYISTNSQRLVKVAVTSGTSTAVITYSGYNSAVVSTEPVADFQYDEFQALITGQATSSLTGKAQDDERKSDINSLVTAIEAFHKTTNFYPSVSNMNTPEWLAANLSTAKDTIFIDPGGTTKQFAAAPTANQYSYQAFANGSGASCANTACGYYKLSATLSDGTVYTKTGGN